VFDFVFDATVQDKCNVVVPTSSIFSISLSHYIEQIIIMLVKREGKKNIFSEERYSVRGCSRISSPLSVTFQLIR
jgi:hypothetical protein